MDKEDLLVTQYQKTVPVKLQILRDHIDLLKNEQSSERLDLLRRDVHKIAGSSGTYGFTTASDLCKRIDLDLQDKMKNFNKAIFTVEWLLSLDRFLKQLEKAFEKPDIIIRF